VRGQVLVSRTHEPNDTTITAELPDLTFDHDRHSIAFDGERFGGHAVYASLDRNGRLWNGWVRFEERHPSFRADNGFITRTDFRSVSAWNGLAFQPDGEFLVAWEPSVHLARVWDYAGRFQDEWIQAGIDAEFTQQTNLEIEGLVSRERFREKIFPGIRRATFSAATRPSETIGVDAELEVGRAIYRTFNPSGEPFLGRIVSASVDASLKLLMRLSLTAGFEYERMKEPAGGGLVYDGWILRNRLNLQVSRELSVRVVTEYDDIDESFALEPLLTYRLNAFSVIYVGMADEYGRFPEEPEEPGGRSWDLGGRQIFGKIQYLLQI
jgi:hypothetical protein